MDHVDEIIKKRFKKGKYTIRDANTDKVIGTYNSGEKASKAMHKLMDTGKYTDLEVKMEEVEIDEEVTESMALQMKMAASDIETYAKKHGGIDKKDMMKVASMLKKGDTKGAFRYTKTLDTDPRDYLLKMIRSTINSYRKDLDALLKTMGEEVEPITEKDVAIPASIDNLKKIVKDKQNAVFMFKDGKVRVDLFSASALVQVYDALKPATKKKFEDMIQTKGGFVKAVDFAFSMAKK